MVSRSLATRLESGTFGDFSLQTEHKGPLAEIRTYAPDNGPSTEYTKIVLFCSGFILEPSKNYRFTCVFEETVVNATVSIFLFIIFGIVMLFSLMYCYCYPLFLTKNIISYSHRVCWSAMLRRIRRE